MAETTPGAAQISAKAALKASEPAVFTARLLILESDERSAFFI
ncbi:MAG: hypothetical protein ACRYGG_11310 [Janthinobacterium lividum]